MSSDGGELWKPQHASASNCGLPASERVLAMPGEARICRAIRLNTHQVLQRNCAASELQGKSYGSVKNFPSFVHYGLNERLHPKLESQSSAAVELPVYVRLDSNIVASYLARVLQVQKDSQS